MILFNKRKGVHVGKRFTFALITKLKNLSIKGMKTFSIQKKIIQNSREWTKDLACETKIIKTTCPELHAINIETHAPISHPIRALCLSIF